jgi:DNA (cytosine-5)-methyltransferase 1
MITERRLSCLDLYAGAGGAGEGYRRAGFDVTGVDINLQPRNPHKFIQADALEFLREHGREYDFIHASPPCQAHTALRSMWKDREYVSLIEPTRKLLKEIGKPYVIENVPGAPLISPILLCGSMFGLGTDGAELRRHRLFELGGWLTGLVPQCQHGKRAVIGVYGDGAGISHARRAKVIGVYGGHGRDRRRTANTQNFTTDQRREAMGIDWMNGNELSQAIPPAYTEFLGRAFLYEMSWRQCA